MTRPTVIGVETGGTKIVCRVVSGDGEAVHQFQLATGEPQRAVEALSRGVATAAPEAKIGGVGVAAFGPVDVDPASPTYGRVLETTKPGWSGFDLAAALSRRFGAPVLIDTDVNAAALAEARSGAGRGLHTLAYITIGTGIGGGLAIGAATLRGALHPEIGHLPLRRSSSDPWPSTCRFHQSCAEGLAAGPAIKGRLAGRRLEDAPEVEALLVDYLGQLCAQVLLAWSPQRIVLGGGVLRGRALLARIHDAMLRELNGYGAARVAALPSYLVSPALEHAGLEGAVILAQRIAGAAPDQA